MLRVHFIYMLNLSWWRKNAFCNLKYVTFWWGAASGHMLAAPSPFTKRLSVPLLSTRFTERVDTSWTISRPSESPASSRCCPEIHAGGLIRNQLSADVLWPDWRFTGCEWWNSVPVSPSRTGLNHYANSCRAGWCHGSGWEREWDSTFSFQTSEVM